MTIVETVRVLADGGVIAIPTDTLYALVCAWNRPTAVEHIRKIRRIDTQIRPLSVLLPDIGELARYARVTHTILPVLSQIFPGPYCTELLATANVPKSLVHDRRGTIGIRVPDSPLCERVIWNLGVPLVAASAKTPRGELLSDAQQIADAFGPDLDFVLDAGPLSGKASTVLSLADDWVNVLREGQGQVDFLKNRAG